MNIRKFWRLFLVLLLPMLIAGWITAEKITKHSDFGEVLCITQKDGEFFNCVWATFEDDNFLRKRYAEEAKLIGDFWIELKDKKNIGFNMERFVSARATSLGNLCISPQRMCLHMRAGCGSIPAYAAI